MTEAEIMELIGRLVVDRAVRDREITRLRALIAQYEERARGVDDEVEQLAADASPVN